MTTNGAFNSYGHMVPAGTGLNLYEVCDPGGTYNRARNMRAYYYPDNMPTTPGYLGNHDPIHFVRAMREAARKLSFISWLGFGKGTTGLYGLSTAQYVEEWQFDGTISGAVATFSVTGAKNPRNVTVTGTSWGRPVMPGDEIVGVTNQLQRAMIVSYISSTGTTLSVALSRSLPTESSAVIVRQNCGDPESWPNFQPNLPDLTANAAGDWCIRAWLSCWWNYRDWTNSVGMVDVLHTDIDAAGAHWFCRKAHSGDPAGPPLIAQYNARCNAVTCPLWTPRTTTFFHLLRVDLQGLWIGHGGPVGYQADRTTDSYVGRGGSSPSISLIAGMRMKDGAGTFSLTENWLTQTFGYLRDTVFGDVNYPYKEIISGAIIGRGGNVADTYPGVITRGDWDPPKSPDGAAWADGTDFQAIHKYLPGVRRMGYVGINAGDTPQGDGESYVPQTVPCKFTLRNLTFIADAVQTIEGHTAIYRADDSLEVYLVRARKPTHNCADVVAATVHDWSIAGDVLTLYMAPGVETCAYAGNPEEGPDETASYLQAGLTVECLEQYHTSNPGASYTGVFGQRDMVQRGCVVWFPSGPPDTNLRHIRLPVLTAQAFAGPAYDGGAIGGVPTSNEPQGEGYPTGFNSWRLNMDRITLDLSGAWGQVLKAWLQGAGAGASLTIAAGMFGIIAPAASAAYHADVAVWHVEHSGAATLETETELTGAGVEIDAANSDVAEGLWTIRVPDVSAWVASSFSQDLHVVGNLLDCPQTMPWQLAGEIDTGIRLLETTPVAITWEGLSFGYAAATHNPALGYGPVFVSETGTWGSLQELTPPEGQGPDMTWYDWTPTGSPAFWIGAGCSYESDSTIVGAWGFVGAQILANIPGGWSPDLVLSAHLNLSIEEALYVEEYQEFVNGVETLHTTTYPDPSGQLSVSIVLLTLDEEGHITASSHIGAVSIASLTEITEGGIIYFRGTVDVTSIVKLILGQTLASNQRVAFLVGGNLEVGQDPGLCMDFVNQWTPATSGNAQTNSFSVRTRHLSYDTISFGSLMITVDHDEVAAVAPHVVAANLPSLVNPA